jgi:endonuclease/exonuclease/phosphatase (EEP) superfamily protein YafD
MWAMLQGTPAKESLRRTWRARLALRARVIAIASALGLALPWLSRALSGREDRFAWAVDLAAHWQWLYLAGLVLGASVAAFHQRRWLFALLLVPLPWWSAAPRLDVAAGGTGTQLTVAAANVYFGTREATALARWLDTVQADLVVLTEVSPAYAAALARLPGFPYRALAPAEDPFGIGVLSRHPMQAAPWRDEDGIARIEARVDLGVACVDLVAVHPIPPIAPRFHAARDRRLKELAARTGQRGGPRLIVGDLNATPWSSAFAGLEQRGLQRSGSLRPTWPSIGRGWIGIPIDHVLASRHWRVLEAGLGPDLGSDHRPVLARLLLDSPVQGGCPP